MEALMPEGPKKRIRTKKEMFGYRAEPEQAEWLKSKMNKRLGVGQTEVLSWAVGLARVYELGTQPHDARLKAYAAEHRLTEDEALLKVVAAGLDALGVK